MSRRAVASETLQKAADAFGLEAGALVFVRDVANVVYGEGDPASCFLRLTHDDDRSPADVAAEMHWLAFLADERLPVCRPRVGRDGAHSERPGENFSAVVLERVRGRPCELHEFGPSVYQAMGRFLGMLHRVSLRYQPPPGAHERLHWHELDAPERVLPSWSPEDDAVAERFREVWARLQQTTIPDDRYGLVHGDVHRGNIFLHADGVDVYDFDDCCRGPLAMDVAHALYYSLWDRRYLPEDERAGLASEFLEHLLREYRREHPFPTADLALLPDLLEYRELAVDAFSHRRRLPDEATKRRWAHVRARLRRGAPYVTLDLEALAEKAE